MTASYHPPFAGNAKRVDLHCHSRASTEADEALLSAIQCPESYSEPREVHAQAKRRGMDFVTITDHDSIAGVAELEHLPDVIIGEEVTCWFPEDQCKMHVLVWGINRTQHEAIQKLAADIYLVADYIARYQIAHSVAHPLYRQNGKLERWHMERLLVIFKGFECLNGAHSMLHRRSLEPMLNELNERSFRKLQLRHGLNAQWPEPWNKSRTGGSDDHGLFNIGRTWTEFPLETSTREQVLECLRTGRCGPGGEAGSSLKLAHNFFGVGMRYYTRQFARSAGSTSNMLLAKRLVGESGPATGSALVMEGIKHLGKQLLGKAGDAMRLRPEARGTALLEKLFVAAAKDRLDDHDSIRSAFLNGQPPLAEHAAMFSFMSDISRDVAAGIAESLRGAVQSGQIGGVFDSLSSIAAHQALLLPYYFALFHQNQERHLLSRIAGRGRAIDRRTLRVGVFTDLGTPLEPATHFAEYLAQAAATRELQLVVHTSSRESPNPSPHWRNFQPLVQESIDAMGGRLVVPPVLEMLQWSDQQQFDVIIANTSGPVGLCGWLASQMLRVPLIAGYHDDLPSQVFGHTRGDFRMLAFAKSYANWFYGRASSLLVRSAAGAQRIKHLDGVAAKPHVVVPPLFNRSRPAIEDRQQCWEKHRVREPVRVVCPANLLDKQDVQLLAVTLEYVWQRRGDVAFVIAGAGPWLDALIEMTRGLPVYCLRVDPDQAELLHRCADLLICPSRTDVTGQFAIDAQGHGVPVIARRGDAAGEFVEDDVTGIVVSSDKASDWAAAIVQLLSDEPRRQRMARTGPHRVRRFTPELCFDAVWDCCYEAASSADSAHPTQETSVASVPEREEVELTGI